MKNLVKDIITLNINEIESYDFPLDKPFGLEIFNDGIKFCFIIRFSSINKNLICCAPVAHQRDSKNSSGQLIKPPYFDRWSWYKYFDESFIAFADPIFFYDETITVGWFVGDKNQWYLETVSKIIKILSKKQNILQNNILFYSSSGGGFASVGLGTLIKGSKVIIDNSQVFIMNFHEGDINNLFNTLYDEFPGLSQSEIIEKINYRLDVIELFKKYEYIPPIHYYVNLESNEDLYDQCMPLVKELKKLKFYTNNLTVFFYKDEKEKPHAPLPNDITIDILKSFMASYLYNNEENNDNKLINNITNLNIQLNNQNLELKNQINLLENLINTNFSENDDFSKVVVFDHATLNDYNDNSFILHRGNIERTSDGTILSGKQGDLFFTPSKNEYYYDIPIVLELTVVDLNDSSNMRLQAYSKKQKLNINFDFINLNIKNNDNVKIAYDGGEFKIFINGELKTNLKSTFTEKFRIGIQTFSENAYIKYKNMKVYKL